MHEEHEKGKQNEIGQDLQDVLGQYQVKDPVEKRVELFLQITDFI